MTKGKSKSNEKPRFPDYCDLPALLDLSGRKGLVIGVAKEQSPAGSAALHFAQAGADLAITYENERTRPHVDSLVERVDAPIFMQCDMTIPGELEAVFDAITERWGQFDFLLHTVSSNRPQDPHGRLRNCSADGFAKGGATTTAALDAPRSRTAIAALDCMGWCDPQHR